jgi:serine carboxypeptidase-like clade 4
VPAIGWKIVDANAQGGQPRLNLQGIAIGNGLVEPLTQYGAYSDFMYNNNMIDEQTHDAVNSAYTDTCAPAITACQASSRAAVRSGLTVSGPNAMACILAADTCNAGVVEPLLIAAAAKKNHSINVYDIRDECSHPPLCYDFSDLEAYMALPDVTAALGVDGHAWTECTTSVHVLLTDDWMQNLEVHIPNVLASGVRVLVYAGNQDFICTCFIVFGFCLCICDADSASSSPAQATSRATGAGWTRCSGTALTRSPPRRLPTGAWAARARARRARRRASPSWR